MARFIGKGVCVFLGVISIYFFQLAIFTLRIQVQAREALGFRLQAFAHLISLHQLSVFPVILRFGLA